MFRSLINDAKTAAGTVIAKYAVRASVAVPFIIAAGFATAALTLALIARFGAVTAFGIVAACFAAIGLLGAAAVSVREQEEAIAEAADEKRGAAELASDAAAQAAVQLPLALLGTLLTTPFGPAAAVGTVKTIGRNLPLVLLLALMALLLWPIDAKVDEREAADEPGEPKPDAGQWKRPNGMDRRAA